MSLQQFIEGAFMFLLGACLGSFGNVVVARLPRGRSLIEPSSRCGFCRSAIRALSNIPILSFFLEKGRCRKCGHPFSIRYAWIEFLMGVLGLALWAQFGLGAQSIFWLVFVGNLVVMSFIDSELRIIPDSLSLGVTGVVLLLVFVAPQIFGDLTWQGSVLGAVIGYSSFWLLSRGYYFLRQEEGLGGGDVKLMALIGAALGFQGVVTATLVGSLLGSVYGLYSLLMMRKSKYYPIPFGPFLALGALIAVFRLDRWIYL